MVVLGKHCFVFDTVHDRTCDVEPFDKTLGVAQKIPIVDAALAYDCPYTHRTYLLIVRNALYVPSMTNNLLPPFILREAGLEVNDVPKIHVPDPCVTDHAITFDAATGLRIPLQLSGIFSFFPTRAPTNDEILAGDPIFLTPDGDQWNPYSDHFAANEDSMLDWEGNIQCKRHQNRHVLDLNVSTATDDYEAAVDNANISAYCAEGANDDESPRLIADDVRSFAYALSTRLVSSKFAMNIGSTGASFHSPIFDHLDNYPLFAVDSINANKPHSVSTDFLAKIWHIKPDEARKVLHQTTQLF